MLIRGNATRRVRAVASVVAAVVLSSGCSVYEDLTTSDLAQEEPEAILAEAGKAMKEATGLRMVGHVRDDGDSLIVDLHFGKRQCSGTIRVNGSRMYLRRVGKKAWVKGDSGLYNRLSGSALPAPQTKRLSKLWVPAADKRMLKFCDVDGMLEGFRVLDDQESGTSTKKDRKKKPGGSATVGGSMPITVEEMKDADGVRVIELRASPGGAHDETIWVSSEAPHYVLKVTSSSTQDGGSLSLSQFDTEVRVEAPAADEIFRG